MPLHGSCAALGGDAVLFLGPPGAGKSDLVLRLMGRGWMLVADDQVELEPVEPDSLMATPPTALRGLLEVRGLGLVRDLPVAAPVRVSVTYSAADTPGVPGTNGVVTTTKARPDAEPWRLDFSGPVAPEPLAIDIVR
jgi:hypothetical protein